VLLERATKFDLARRRRLAGLLRRDDVEHNAGLMRERIGESFDALRRDLPACVAGALTTAAVDAAMETRVRAELEAISNWSSDRARRLGDEGEADDYDSTDETPKA
jgi:hypothetical protein